MDRRTDCRNNIVFCVHSVLMSVGVLMSLFQALSP